MNKPKKETNRHSAGHICNGFSFEYAAALFIFLTEIGNVKAFCIEDKDDIRLILNNNDEYYAQAKSSSGGDQIAANHKAEIIESIKSILDNDKKNVTKLISIFNYFKPLGENDAFSHSSDYDKKKFYDLTSKVQKDIQNKIGKSNGDYSKVELWYLRYEGVDKDTALVNFVKEKIAKILDPCDKHALTNQWLAAIQKNAPQNEMIYTDNMCTILLAQYLDANAFFNTKTKFNIDIPIEKEEYVKRILSDFISINSLKFLNFNRTIAACNTYSKSHDRKNRDTMIAGFINEYSQNKNVRELFDNFTSNFIGNEKSEYLSILSKLYVGYVCLKSETIKQIKELFKI